MPLAAGSEPCGGDGDPRRRQRRQGGRRRRRRRRGNGACTAACPCTPKHARWRCAALAAAASAAATVGLAGFALAPTAAIVQAAKAAEAVAAVRVTRVALTPGTLLVTRSDLDTGEMQAVRVAYAGIDVWLDRPVVVVASTPGGRTGEGGGRALWEDPSFFPEEQVPLDGTYQLVCDPHGNDGGGGGGVPGGAFTVAPLTGRAEAASAPPFGLPVDGDFVVRSAGPGTDEVGTLVSALLPAATVPLAPPQFGRFDGAGAVTTLRFIVSTTRRDQAQLEALLPSCQLIFPSAAEQEAAGRAPKVIRSAGGGGGGGVADSPTGDGLLSGTGAVPLWPASGRDVGGDGGGGGDEAGPSNRSWVVRPDPWVATPSQALGPGVWLPAEAQTRCYSAAQALLAATTTAAAAAAVAAADAAADSAAAAAATTVLNHSDSSGGATGKGRAGGAGGGGGAGRVGQGIGGSGGGGDDDDATPCVPLPGRVNLHGAYALIETQLKATVTGTDMPMDLVKGLLDGPLGAVLKPVSSLLGAIVGAAVGGVVDMNMGGTTTPGIAQRVNDGLKAALLAGLSTSLVRPLTAQAAAAISDSAAQSLRSFVTLRTNGTMAHPMLTALTAELAKMLPQIVARSVPQEVTRRLMVPLQHSLSRSLTQSIVPALMHVLTHSPLQDYYCYYCQKHKAYCAYCHSAPQQLYYATQYSAYYSTYFATFYAKYFSSRLVSEVG